MLIEASKSKLLDIRIVTPTKKITGYYEFCGLLYAKT